MSPSFRLGNEDSWLLEQRYPIDGKEIDDSKFERSKHEVEQSSPPRVVSKQRNGWYLTRTQFTLLFEDLFPSGGYLVARTWLSLC